MNKLIFLLIVASPCLVSCQNILQLVVQTGVEIEDSGCDCSIGVSITNTNLLTCDISELESAADDFESSVAIGYEGSQLGACLGFPLPDRDALLTLIHNDEDGWVPEYVRIILDDGTWIECPNEDGLILDDNSFIELNCYP